MHDVPYWWNRIRSANRAADNGEPGELHELCAELEKIPDPAPKQTEAVTPVVVEIPAVKTLVMPPQPPPFPFHG